jgi:hypothetical protein
MVLVVITRPVDNLTARISHSRRAGQYLSMFETPAFTIFYLNIPLSPERRLL